jgi:hypothetical protein
LNEGEERDQPTDQVVLRDDGVEIDLTSREEIESALKFLKNNKVARADSVAAELLKNGGLQLVDVLEEVILLAWAKHYLKAGPRGYCIQCIKKATNSIAPI